MGRRPHRLPDLDGMVYLRFVFEVFSAGAATRMTHPLVLSDELQPWCPPNAGRRVAGRDTERWRPSGRVAEVLGRGAARRVERRIALAFA